jgi:hypothetical protein
MSDTATAETLPRVSFGWQSLASRWSELWFAPAAPTNLAVGRMITAATALWVVLSRPMLPSLLTFPRAMWSTVPEERLIRFLLVFDPRIEQALWIVLHIVLTLTLFGVASRWMALGSALLMYHFAPLETIFRTGNPYLRGFTIPTLALLIVGASASGGAFMRRARSHPEWASWQHRWPLTLIQCLFCFLYAAAAYSKLFMTGVAWMHASNIRNYLLAIHQALDIRPPALGLWIADFPLLCAAIGVGGITIEFAFPLVMVSRIARRILVPTMAVFHILNAVLFHINFQNIAMLLVFVDWEALGSSWRARR